MRILPRFACWAESWEQLLRNNSRSRLSVISCKSTSGSRPLSRRVARSKYADMLERFLWKTYKIDSEKKLSGCTMSYEYVPYASVSVRVLLTTIGHRPFRSHATFSHQVHARIQEYTTTSDHPRTGRTMDWHPGRRALCPSSGSSRDRTGALAQVDRDRPSDRYRDCPTPAGAISLHQEPVYGVYLQVCGKALGRGVSADESGRHEVEQCEPRICSQA
jgi:hypothetical protein